MLQRILLTVILINRIIYGAAQANEESGSFFRSVALVARTAFWVAPPPDERLVTIILPDGKDFSGNQKRAPTRIWLGSTIEAKNEVDEKRAWKLYSLEKETTDPSQQFLYLKELVELANKGVDGAFYAFKQLLHPDKQDYRQLPSPCIDRRRADWFESMSLLRFLQLDSKSEEEQERTRKRLEEKLKSAFVPPATYDNAQANVDNSFFGRLVRKWMQLDPRLGNIVLPDGMTLDGRQVRNPTRTWFHKFNNTESSDRANDLMDLVEKTTDSAQQFCYLQELADLAEQGNPTAFYKWSGIFSEMYRYYYKPSLPFPYTDDKRSSFFSDLGELRYDQLSTLEAKREKARKKLDDMLKQRLVKDTDDSLVITVRAGETKKNQ